MSEELTRILDLVRESKRILITSHRDPDGDSVGSQLALAELVESMGKGCRIINQGDLPGKYLFLDPNTRIENVEALTGGRKDVDSPADLVLVLDCTSMRRVGDVEKLIPPAVALVNIDHHPDNEDFGIFNYVDANASATGEIVFNLLRSADFCITPAVANQLYAAILSDTGRFKFSNTSPGCLRVCAELLAAGADSRYVTNQIYFDHSPAFMKLLGSMLSSPQILSRGRICVMTLDHDLLADLKIDPREVEGVADYSLFLKGVEIGLLFTEKANEEVKVNLRSQNQFDVSKVARRFGGGGHKNAAGCTLNRNLKKAKSIILEQIQRALKNEPVRNFGGKQTVRGNLT